MTPKVETHLHLQLKTVVQTKEKITFLYVTCCFRGSFFLMLVIFTLYHFDRKNNIFTANLSHNEYLSGKHLGV